MSMIDAKVTREFDFTNTVLTEEAEENIQEFVSIWASKFKVNFKKDITLTIRAKHNDDGANLIVKLKEVDVEQVDLEQMNLFVGNTEKVGNE